MKRLRRRAMTDTRTQIDRNPPAVPPTVGAAFAGDEAEELGARIMALRPDQKRLLARFVKERVTCDRDADDLA